MKAADQAVVEREWQHVLSAEGVQGTARDLYRSRGFRIAVQAADALQADLGIISAGLGYVTAETRVPGYNLTISPTSFDSVRTRIEGSFSPTSWWSSVASGPFSTALSVDIKSRPLVAICLSRDYASMISDELLRGASGIELRIFGLSIARSLPASLRHCVLPYDERLSQIALGGTRRDFPQRALLYHVTTVLAKTGIAINREKELVNCSLSTARRFPPRKFNRVSDQTIKARIKALLSTIGRRRSKLLAHLRHVEKISCEQKRFSALYEDVFKEIEV